jgi:hypothetical protein
LQGKLPCSLGRPIERRPCHLSTPTTVKRLLAEDYDFTTDDKRRERALPYDRGSAPLPPWPSSTDHPLKLELLIESRPQRQWRIFVLPGTIAHTGCCDARSIESKILVFQPRHYTSSKPIAFALRQHRLLLFVDFAVSKDLEAAEGSYSGGASPRQSVPRLATLVLVTPPYPSISTMITDGRALPPPWFSFIVCCETAVALAMESDALTLGACTVGTPIKVPRPLNSNNASAARVINRPSARRHCWRPSLLGKNELL